MVHLAWRIPLNGHTKLLGAEVNGGSPKVATIAFELQGLVFSQLHRDVFIVGTIDNHILKMVKIRVLGETTFEWMEAKYRPSSYECLTQSRFSQDCFHGTAVSDSGQMDLQLTAEIVSGKRYILIP